MEQTLKPMLNIRPLGNRWMWTVGDGDQSFERLVLITYRDKEKGIVWKRKGFDVNDATSAYKWCIGEHEIHAENTRRQP